jgi:hypothetical protein
VHDLSLHILDLMENSIRAEATVIAVTVAADPERDRLTIAVEDDGRGLSVPAAVAADPFYTTKAGKRTGLGLSLFRDAAEQAGGSLVIGRSNLGGAAVRAEMRLSHVDRAPLGDLAATLSSVVCTNPGLDVRCRLQVGDRAEEVRVSEIAKGLPVGACRGLVVARQVSERIRNGVAALQLTA